LSNHSLSLLISKELTAHSSRGVYAAGNIF